MKKVFGQERMEGEGQQTNNMYKLTDLPYYFCASLHQDYQIQYQYIFQSKHKSSLTDKTSNLQNGDHQVSQLNNSSNHTDILTVHAGTPPTTSQRPSRVPPPPPPRRPTRKLPRTATPTSPPVSRPAVMLSPTSSTSRHTTERLMSTSKLPSTRESYLYLIQA